jgi:ATP-dependent Clp protease ATP-binding subunit ClpC
MAKDRYEVTTVILDTVEGFEVLVLTLPENELNDKLAYLAREKGKISRSFYEDFIIASCVGNINQLLGYINQNYSETSNLLEIRAELMEQILKLNPLIAPENLVINKNFVVKVMTTKKPRTDEKLLTDNSSWNTSYYEDLNNLKEAITDKLHDSDDDTASKKKNAKSKLKSKASEKTRDLEELEFEEKQVWWRRIGQYVKIKKFKEEDAVDILKKRYFHSPTSFNTFIVSVCVVDFEDLFLLLDNMGIPTRVAPPILMNELYELCKSINEFLTYENAQDLADEPDEAPGRSEGDGKPYRTTAAGPMSQHAKKGKQKTFKDIPKEDLLNLAANMKVSLIGQDEAIDTLADAIQRASVGLKDPVRPIGSFLFAGRTGVGKTLATKVLADELIKGRDNLITIDCSEYSSDHEYAKLIGAPSGYIGHEQGGVLTNAMMKNPFAVVVFDEVEKASAKVHELMLQVLEEGRLTDGKGQKVSFRDAIIVMTSNVGAKEIGAISKTIGFGDAAKITDSKKDVALKEALKKKFKPEFLNRIDAVVNFRTLSKKDYMKIIDIELFKLNDNLKHNDTDYKGLSLAFEKSVSNYIYKHGINEEYGARPLKRCIENEIATPLARKILKEDLSFEAMVNVSFKKGRVDFKVEKKVEEVPFYLTEGGQANGEAK